MPSASLNLFRAMVHTGRSKTTSYYYCVSVFATRKRSYLRCVLLHFALTPAQNSRAVTHVEYASVEMIRATIAALESDLPPAAVKLGMMGTDAVVSVVGEFLGSYKGKVVCDPVMISTRCV